MSSISIRFPDGSREFRYPERPLEVGDVLHHDGERYRVLSVSNNDDGRDRATVELIAEDLLDKLQSEEGGLRLVPAESSP
jgi:hypothetical protein